LFMPDTGSRLELNAVYLFLVKRIHDRLCKLKLD
jgi:hypothetical protein